MPSDPRALHSLIAEIRGAFNDLKTYSDTQNEDLQITAAMRAVMEHIEGNGAQSMPVIAKEKTSRASISSIWPMLW